MKAKITGTQDHLRKFVNILLGLGYSIHNRLDCQLTEFLDKKVYVDCIFLGEPDSFGARLVTADEASFDFKSKLNKVPEVNLPKQANHLLEKIIDIDRRYDKIPEDWYYLEKIPKDNSIMIKQSDGNVKASKNRNIVTSPTLADAIKRKNEFMPAHPKEHYVLCPIKGKILPYPEPPYTVKVSIWNNTIILNGQIIVFNGEPIKFINKNRFKEEEDE